MGRLEEWPERVDRLGAQILQSRQETRDDFSNVRIEMREQGEQLRTEMREQGEQLRTEMRQQGDQLRTEMHEQGTRLEGLIHAEVDALAAHTHRELVDLGVMLTDKIDTLNGKVDVLAGNVERGLAENATQSRMLYEDLVTRITTLGEGSRS